MKLIGQITGSISGVFTCSLWLMAMWFPSADINLSGVSLIVAFIMALLAIIVVIASIKSHGMVLIILFAASFFPIGFYLLDVPHWLYWVGILNLGYLFAGILLLFTAVRH